MQSTASIRLKEDTAVIDTTQKVAWLLAVFLPLLDQGLGAEMRELAANLAIELGDAGDVVVVERTKRVVLAALSRALALKARPVEHPQWRTLLAGLQAPYSLDRVAADAVDQAEQHQMS